MKNLKTIFASMALLATGCMSLSPRERFDTLAGEIREKAVEFYTERNCKIKGDYSYKEEGRQVQICFNLSCAKTGPAIGCIARSMGIFDDRAEFLYLDPHLPESRVK